MVPSPPSLLVTRTVAAPLLLLFILSTAHGFRLQPCASTTGANVASSVCQSTPAGVSCPANYYCPLYESNQIATYSAVLLENSCVYGAQVSQLTHNASYIVLCPCTPGFYCPANTELPGYCPAGNYCPPNANSTVNPLTRQPLPSSGLGAFGSLVYQCPKGTWCPAGQVVPFECNRALSDCAPGSVDPVKTKNWILLGFIVGFIFLLFQVSEYISLKERKLQDMSIADELANNKASGGGGTITAMHTDSLYAAPSAPSFTSSIKTPLMGGGEPDDGTAVLALDHEDQPAFHISFENISLTLPSKVTVMANVYGSFRPRRLCAIMGPSGAGKTTVINLITGKVKRSAGRVLVNGVEVEGLSNMSKLVGFVPQDDVMIRELTVRDNISFSARYRLPANLDGPHIEAKINSCINELGISHVQHSVIGDERTRGISGGQRKRVNIGIELVADPSILFLDEPTSGLDSTSSTALCATLKRIAQARSMTIAAVIHQPSMSSFLKFDDLLLLGKGGRVVYHGPVSDAPAYFASIGFPLPANHNPADFYLDVTQGAAERVVDGCVVKFEWVELFDMWEEFRNSGGGGVIGAGASSSSGSPRHSQEQRDSFKDSGRQSSMSHLARRDLETVSAALESTKDASSICANLPDIISSFTAETCAFFSRHCTAIYIDLHDALFCGSKDERQNSQSVTYARTTPSIWTQFYLCLMRALKQIFVGFRPFVAEMALHLVCGAVISTAAARLSFLGPLPDPVCAIQTYSLQAACVSPQASQYVQVGNFMSFGILFAAIASSSATFGSEQVNYWRECSAGLSSIPYFFGRWLANFPRIVLSALFFFFSFSIKFSNTGKALGLYQIILSLYWFGYSLGYVVSQLVPIQHAALLGVVLALIFAVGFAGANPNMNEVRDKPAAESWFWSLSGPRWALEAFYINSITYYEYIPGNSKYNSLYVGQSYMDVEAGLAQVGYDISNFRVDMQGLFLDGLFWSLIALLLMILTHKDKKK